MKKERKTYKLTIRVSEDEYKNIKLKSEILGLSISRFVTDKAVNSYVKGYTQARKEIEEKENELKQIEGQIGFDDIKND